MLRLGKKYPAEIAVTSKAKGEYEADNSFELDLSVGPAVMAGDEIAGEGMVVPELEVEKASAAILICRNLRRLKGLQGSASRPSNCLTADPRST